MPENIIEVSNWYFVIRSDKRLNYGSRNFFVCIEGHKPGDASTFIRSHILEPAPPTNGILKAKNGRLYKVCQPLNQNFLRLYGFPPDLIEKFIVGIPKNWLKLLTKFYDWKVRRKIPPEAEKLAQEVKQLFKDKKITIDEFQRCLLSSSAIQPNSLSDKTQSQTTDDSTVNNDIRCFLRRNDEIANGVQDVESQTDILSPIVNIKDNYNGGSNRPLMFVNAKNTSTPLKRVNGVIEPALKHFDLYLKLVRDIKPTTKSKWNELFELYDEQIAPKVPFFVTPLPIVEPPKKNCNIINNAAPANNENKVRLRNLPKMNYTMNIDRSLRVECENIQVRRQKKDLPQNVVKKKTNCGRKKRPTPVETAPQPAPPPKKFAVAAATEKRIEPPKLLDKPNNDVPDFFKSMPDHAQLKLISMPFRDDFSLATTPGSLAGQSRIFGRRSETDISVDECTTNDIFHPAASQPKKNVEQYVRQIQRSKPKRKVAESKAKNMAPQQKQPILKAKQVKSKIKKVNDMFQKRDEKLNRLRRVIDSDQENDDEDPAPRSYDTSSVYSE